ncbi:hypothetical Protein YC6258_00061 [Gynuella sunshinyii YC6258]|uniref:Uncharacterized protein n=1 Tax=Gynuella sunshinyii YC6258 TaxID=1445510 RepID=A0A0C5VC87_9GAMM|nr:hypothetical Protein YC6258_00061 [Gynuella sunshinyii YC6258]
MAAMYDMHSLFERSWSKGNFDTYLYLKLKVNTITRQDPGIIF